MHVCGVWWCVQSPGKPILHWQAPQAGYGQAGRRVRERGAVAGTASVGQWLGLRCSGWGCGAMAEIAVHRVCAGLL